MNKPGSVAEGSHNANEESFEARLLPFASEVLTHFESTAAKAEAAFAAGGRVSVSSLATINTLNAARALENLGRASAANRSDLYQLRSEPAISRLVVVDESDRQGQSSS